MKKTLAITLLAVAVAYGVQAQGTVTFNNRVAGVNFSAIYGLGANAATSLQGNATTNPVSPGAIDYTGYPLLSGAGFTAQLFGGPQGTAEGSLTPVLPTTTFRTGAAAGFVNPVTGTVQGVLENGNATLQLRVWDNAGGTITSWAQVLPNTPHGVSPTFNVNGLGGIFTTAPNIAGLQSFNLFAVPEPSVIALGLLGVGALLLRRRKTA